MRLPKHGTENGRARAGEHGAEAALRPRARPLSHGSPRSAARAAVPPRHGGGDEWDTTLALHYACFAAVKAVERPVGVAGAGGGRASRAEQRVCCREGRLRERGRRQGRAVPSAGGRRQRDIWDDVCQEVGDPWPGGAARVPEPHAGAHRQAA
jgi:hypothetical protein